MKKNEALFRAVGEVGDDLIARAEQPVQKKNVVWLRWTALAACCVLIVGIAAFARLTLDGAKSASAVTDVAGTNQAALPESYSAESSAPESVEAVEEEAVAEETAPDFKANGNSVMMEEPAESAPAESAPIESPAQGGAEDSSESLSEGYTKRSLSDAPSFTFAGVQYVQTEEPGTALQPGEQLGVVEESSDNTLLGCEIYACGDSDPSHSVLLLLDGEYLLFRNAETLSPAE